MIENEIVFLHLSVAGKVKEIRRGAKRAITDVIIEVSSEIAM